MKTTKTEQLKQFHYVSNWAKELIEKIPEEIEIDETREFKIVTLKDLGFTKDWIETKKFLNNDFLLEHDLELCKLEDAFRIIELLKEGEYCYVGMKPITGSGGDPGVFDVERGDDGKRWLDGRWTSPDGRWGLDGRVVFRLRKPLGTQFSETLPSTQSLSPLSLEKAIKVVKEAGYQVSKII